MITRSSIIVTMFLIAVVCHAAPCDIGGTTIQVPPPSGFMQAAKGMPVAESVMAIGTDRYNLVLGMYVPNQDGVLDRAGKLDGYRRHALAKVANSLVGATLSSRDFKELAAYGTSAEQMAEISKAIDIASSEIERNSKEHPDNRFGHVKMDFEKPVVFPVHVKTASCFGYSLTMSAMANMNGQSEYRRVAATFMTTCVAGKVLNLYVYSVYDAGGREAAVKWTRDTADGWMKAISAANVVQGSIGGTIHATGWKGILQQSLAMALVGGVFALLGSGVAVILSRRKRGDDEQEK